MNKDRKSEEHVQQILCECEKQKIPNISSCGARNHDQVPEIDYTKVPDLFQIDTFAGTNIKLSSVFYPRVPAKPSRIINGHLPNKAWHKYKQLYTKAEIAARGPDFGCECWVCVPAERAY